MLYSLNSPCLMLNWFFSCPLFLALSSKDEQRSKLHTEYNCCCDIPCRKQGIKLIHKVFLLPFIFSRATLSTQTYPAYLSDDLSCWAYFQVLDCDLTITCGFCMLEGPCAIPSMVRAASTPQCHIVWPGEHQLGPPSYNNLKPMVNWIILSLQLSRESPFLSSSV